MKKLFFLLLCVLVLLTGCSTQIAGSSSDQVPDEKNEGEVNTELSAEEKSELSINDKFELISFTLKDGYYTRTVIQEGSEFVEMFIPEKDSFVRIMNEEDEQEVYSYNYKTTEFTYVYYIADEKVIKVAYNIDKDEVVEDEDDFIDLLKTDAVELKRYFESLIEEVGIELDEL